MNLDYLKELLKELAQIAVTVIAIIVLKMKDLVELLERSEEIILLVTVSAMLVIRALIKFMLSGQNAGSYPYCILYFLMFVVIALSCYNYVSKKYRSFYKN